MWKWLQKRRTTNSADNSSTANVTVSSNQDQCFYYQLGTDMSTIAKNSDLCMKRVERLNHKIDRIWKTIDDHEDRIKKLENKDG